MSVDRQPHAMRFGLLSGLCFELGERQECGSMLMHPRRGESVLLVPYRSCPQRRLGVMAVEYRGCWLYAFGDQWGVAGDVAETAARIAWAVRTR